MFSPFLRLFVVIVLLFASLSAADDPHRSSEYQIKLTTGKQIPLSAYRSKTVLLAFLNTDCPHCQSSAQMLNKLHREYRSRGLHIIGIAVNRDADKLAPEFIKTYKIEFPIGIESRNSACQYLGIDPGKTLMVPIFVFIDREGKIQEQHDSADVDFFRDEENSVRGVIERLLKSSKPPRKEGTLRSGPGKS